VQTPVSWLCSFHPNLAPEEGSCHSLLNLIISAFVTKALTCWTGLGTLAVRSAYRRRGAGSLMVQWGVEKADEMGIESFVEASWYGSQVYRKHGFLYIDDVKPKRPPQWEGNTDWDLLESKYAFGIEWLWRPKKDSNLDI
jgi:GNAT superfamily N-acetyltransferase